MLKKTITFKDYNDVERTEDHYFNLKKSELLELQLSVEGGLTQYIQKLISQQDMPKLMELFKKIVKAAYGVKSDDGRRFMKSEEIFKEFEETEAYSELFMEISTDDKKAAEFFNAIIPPELQNDGQNEPAQVVPMNK
ncbi:MAG: hypothetical protein J6Y02_17470 [Pseudobutyrivibrio sp.]|nr:hypothetical protein [Pseudobutyrivibrio sp.]